MPGDTKVHKTANGWIDDDQPNTFYSIRQQARDARRQARVQGQVAQTHTPRRNPSIRTTSHTVVGLQHTATGIPAGQQVLSSLQNRLLVRLTNKQGVAQADAIDVILSNGYNKAASYGHMRCAGATDSEAKIVIGLGSPDVSVAYGKGRANGLDHTKALAEALKCQANA